MTALTSPRIALTMPTGRTSVAWERIGLTGLLLVTAFFFLWGLDRNGWANPYYSAAAQAGSQDWKAFFFGSVEWGNLITVDKTPLSIWIMSLSVRVFGLSSWSILVPQALMGVATTYLVFRILRRGFGAAPALLGGAIYATTPVVCLMSRFNNPEPLMGLLMVAAVAVTLRAIEGGRLRTFALAGFFLGLAFMAKQIQAFLVIPALSVAVLALSCGPFGRRVRQVFATATTLLATSAAWLLAVELTPGSQRPFIGGSTTNSAVELTLNYNGLARFIEIPMTASGNRPTSSHDELASQELGFRRIFNANFGPEIAWLLFPAIAVVIALALLNRSLKMTQNQARITVVATVWFSLVLIVLCVMGTMMHTYYTFSLGAPIALVIPIGLTVLWQRRGRLVIRCVGALIVAASVYMVLRLFDYSDAWPLWSRILLIATGVISTAGWLFGTGSNWRKATLVTLALSLLIGPVGTDSYTLTTSQTGTNPLSGPVASDPRAMSRLMIDLKAGIPPWAHQTAFGATPTPSVTELLRQTKGQQDWAAATYSAQNAALYQLESGRPVIPLGGWLGTDPAPTLVQFKQLVNQGRVAYFIWQQDLLDRNELSPATVEISHWVELNFKEQEIDGVRIYDLRR